MEQLLTDTSGTYTLIGVAGSPVSAEAAAGAAVTYIIQGVADIFDVTADAAASVAINQTVNVADGLNLVADGGTISLSANQPLDTITATIENGGSLVSNGYFRDTSLTSSVTFGDGGGSFILGIAGTFRNGSLSQLIGGFTGPDDVIDDQALKFSGVTGYTIAAGATAGQQTLTINDTSGTSMFTLSGTSFATGSYTSPTSGPLVLDRDANGGTNIEACFLSGVRIATPNGEVPVQDLVADDMVLVLEDGKLVSRRAVWIGSRTVKLGRNAMADAHPVRIRAGAFADSVPHRDLLVTSEHCIHVHGRLIPVRMLVNGGSIVIDTGITSFTYYHIELDRHGILIADGLEVESYLDTGNRVCFADSVQSLRPHLSVNPSYNLWQTEAAAPLAVDRETVEPVWEELRQHAVMLGYALPEPPILIQDPDLHLVSDAGYRIMPTLSDGRFFAFIVPTGVREVRLASRTARPADTSGPFLDDRRALGVLVGRIGIYQGHDRRSFDLHLTDSNLAGWHSIENNACRWTNGNALLPFAGFSTSEQPTYIDIEIVNAGPYVVSMEGREMVYAA